MSASPVKMLRIGDVVEFRCGGYPPPPRDWQPERVEEIRVVEDFDDKEGVLVDAVSWQDISEYYCLVVVLGTEHWARNDQIRPVQT
jgi:hypothetical protein